MTLGEIIKEYRMKNDMSMGAFAERSGISKAYIGVLEKNQHPGTGKPITPSIKCIKQAAIGMQLDFDKLFSMVDGEVSLTDDDLFSVSELEVELLRKYRKLGDREQGRVDQFIDDLLEKKSDVSTDREVRKDVG